MLLLLFQPKFVVLLSGSMKCLLISGTHLGPLTLMSSRILSCRFRFTSSSCFFYVHKNKN